MFNLSKTLWQSKINFRYQQHQFQLIQFWQLKYWFKFDLAFSQLKLNLTWISNFISVSTSFMKKMNGRCKWLEFFYGHKSVENCSLLPKIQIYLEGILFPLPFIRYVLLIVSKNCYCLVVRYLVSNILRHWNFRYTYFKNYPQVSSSSVIIFIGNFSHNVILKVT